MAYSIFRLQSTSSFLLQISFRCWFHFPSGLCIHWKSCANTCFNDLNYGLARIKTTILFLANLEDCVKIVFNFFVSLFCSSTFPFKITHFWKTFKPKVLILGTIKNIKPTNNSTNFLFLFGSPVQTPPAGRDISQRMGNCKAVNYMKYILLISQKINIYYFGHVFFNVNWQLIPFLSKLWGTRILRMKQMYFTNVSRILPKSLPSK